MVSLVAGIVSVLLGFLAIGVSLYFYTQTKNTEKDLGKLLEGIRTQTDALQKIVGRQMDRLIRGVTDQPSSDFSAVYEMIGAIKEIPTTVITLLQAPSSSSSQAVQWWKHEAIKGYIGAYYYSALTNIAHQYFLPPLDQLLPEDRMKRVVDSSHADFTMLDEWFPKLDKEDLTRNTLYHLHQEAQSWKPFIKDSTATYAQRAASVPPVGQTT